MRLPFKVGNKWQANWCADVTVHARVSPVTCAMGPRRSLGVWNCSMPRKCNLHQQGTTNEVTLAHKPLSLPFRFRYIMGLNQMDVSYKSENLSHSSSRLGVTYKTGFGLDDWTYCSLYIHMLGTTGNTALSLF
jgi:hypothetical protein